MTLYSFGKHKLLEIAELPGKGRGLFALDSICRDEVIEVAPVLVLETEVSEFLLKYHEVADSLFLWEGSQHGKYLKLAIGFGLVSMCNHSLTSNSKILRLEAPSPRLVLVATQEIMPGEEITLTYSYPLQTFSF